MLLKNMLKLFGICSLLILFEACYGTQKAAFAPIPKKDNSKEQANKSTTIEQNTNQKVKN